MEQKIDARGKQCPLPVIEAKKAIESMTEGGVITVTVDNEIAVQNILKMAKQKGIDTEYACISKEEYVVYLTVGEMIKQEVKKPESKESSILNHEIQAKKKTVVVISSNVMGSGDDKLGKILMKGFIFALTKQDTLPDTMIFYNSGAFLVAEDSESLEDLKSLKEEGVEILVCGTCLDFYELTQKRKIGSITNMYTITEILMNAELIIRP